MVAVLWPALLSAQKDSAKSHFDKWLKEDVAYIITPEERSVFEKLTTDEERETFIEQFWTRRDPTPGSAANEFKEEHYRRIQYANEHYAAGFPGWRTDRGRIYITFGPPDETRSNPTGGTYTRELYEGGGTTQTYPFEVWWYRHLQGVGDDIEIEFVDRLDSGNYRIARDPFEKDALFNLGGGQTYWEARGLITRSELNTQRYLGNPSSPYVRGIRPQDQPLQRLSIYNNLMKPPPIRFGELRTVVESKISYDQLPLGIITHVKPLTEDTVLASVTANIQVTAENFVQVVEGLWQAQSAVYGRVTDLAGKLVYEFDDELTSRSRIDPARRPRPFHLYQRKLTLHPGRYKLELVVRETATKKLGTAESLVLVTRPSAELQAQLILANGVTPAGPGETVADPFVVGDDLKVYPSPDKMFAAQGKLGVYLEL
ncbi:MAG: GWxTD domain-containing protein, partial [Acidobacteria bacterium]